MKRFVDERIQRIIQLQDPDILPDLRHLNEGRPEKYKIFWEHCKKFIEECSAVDECCHGETTHLACAMSVRDLVDKVASMFYVPGGNPIPSRQWVRLQFWPKNPTAKVSLQYTGKLRVKFMV